MIRGIIAGLVVLTLLAGCQLFSSPPTPDAAALAAPSRATLEATVAEKLKGLPGAVPAGVLAVDYPGEVLFARGAVLPLPGGVEMLAPLAAALRAGEDLRWQGVVRAETGVSAEYDRLLAEARLKLLWRYLHGQGITVERLVLRAEPGAGAPLSIALQTEAASAASAAGVKP